MKIVMEQQRELQETEVRIRYQELSEQVKNIRAVLHAMDTNIAGKCDGNVYQLNTAEIYYIESVDKRTYIYCKNQVYETGERLYQLEEKLIDSGFVRVSKKCIVNKYKLKGMKILPNSHIEAMLSNGEKLLVTRKYISEIRKALERK
ncbi:MAG: LytTR family transcriptional regulator [Lachnospiraceae bacterium]|nr:LytTR family transcriptional regulator [Lachnospiraceae bacterium]